MFHIILPELSGSGPSERWAVEKINLGLTPISPLESFDRFLVVLQLKSAFSHDIVSNRVGANTKARKAAKAWMDEQKKVTEHKVNK